MSYELHTVGTMFNGKVLHSLRREGNIMVSLCNYFARNSYKIDHSKTFPTCKRCIKAIVMIERRNGLADELEQEETTNDR